MAGEFLGALTGGAIGSAVVRLVLDSSQYQKELTEAKGNAYTATSSMGKSFTAFKAAAVAGLAAAGTAALQFASDAVASAVEAEQVLSKLKVAVGENTEAYEAQATALQGLTGFQDEAILSADTILSRFKLTGDQVRRAIPIVLDYARATGKDVPAAASAIGKALLGNARALKEVGIDYTRTGDRSKDFADILDLLAGKVGGTAEAFGKTTAGQLEIARAKFDEVKESIGSELLPVLNDILPVLASFAEIVGSTVVEALDEAAASTGPLLDALGLLGDALSLIGGSGGEAEQFGDSIRSDVIEGVLDMGGPFLGAVRDIGRYQNAMQQARHEQALWIDEHVDTRKAAQDVGDAVAGAVAPIASLAGANRRGANAARDAALALHEEREAMRLLIGGQVGLLQAQADVRGAQETYNEAVEDYGPKSRKAREAALDLVSAQLELKTQLAEQKQLMRESGETADTAAFKFAAFAEKAGVLRSTIAGLNEELRTFNALAGVNAGSSVDFSGRGAPAGFDIDASLRDRVNRGAA